MKWFVLTIFISLTACSCATSNVETYAPYTCETLNQIWQNDVRDELLMESCLQQIPNQCLHSDTTCVQSRALMCIEAFFEEKKLQTKDWRTQECWRHDTVSM